MPLSPPPPEPPPARAPTKTVQVGELERELPGGGKHTVRVLDVQCLVSGIRVSVPFELDEAEQVAAALDGRSLVAPPGSDIVTP